jgi:hypothetical protein
MKTVIETFKKRSGRTLFSLVLAGSTLTAYSSSFLPVATSLSITRNVTNKKHKVKLFTASDYKTLLFSVDGVGKNRYTLYIFDLDGRLINQSAILNQETGVLSGIPAGSYSYVVLADDTKVENGQLKLITLNATQ